MGGNLVSLGTLEKNYLSRESAATGEISLRICLISREYPPDTGWGGIGAYTFQHAHALLEAGHEVEVISLCKLDGVADSYPENLTDSSAIRVHRAVWGNLLQELSTIWITIPYSHFALKSALALWRKFLEIHSQRPFDVIEAPEHLAEAIFPALTHICPLVVRLHTPHSKFVRESYHNLEATFDQRLVSILERTAMLEADVLSSPSVALASYVAFDAGVELKTIEIVPNPVDTKRFTPDGSRAIAEDNKVTVFFAGRLEERKGVHYLVEAIPTVLANCKNVRFLIVGADTKTGPGKSSVLNELTAKLDKSGALKAVQFIKHVELTEMPSYYRSGDICVVPSLYENAPYTVLEASASGRPVIGTNGGGSPEYIADGQTGIVVPVKDSIALANAIIELVNDEARRLEMGNNGRKRAIELYGTKIIASEAAKTYQLAIERHKLAISSGLYRYKPEDSLYDFVQLLYSYHESQCALLYRHSLSYRIKHWWTNATKRPKLTAAKLFLALVKRLPNNGESLPFLQSQKLIAKVNELDRMREKQIMEDLLKACQIPLKANSN